MRRKLTIILVALSFVSYTSNAYAIMDIPARVQSFFEQVKKELKKVEEYRRKLEDLKKSVTQGVGMAQQCAANPLHCDLNGLTKVGINSINGFNSISKNTKDLFKKNSEELAQGVRDTEYTRGSGDAINAVYENRQENNAVTTDDIARLYAKATAIRQSILKETDEIYPEEDKLDSINKIIIAQGNVELMSNLRLVRILEMRAYMNSGRSVAGLTQHTQSADEKK